MLENRKLVARVLDDVDVSMRLLGNSLGENVNQWLRILPPKDGGGRAASDSGYSDGHHHSSLDRSPIRGGLPASNGSRLNAVSPARMRPISPSSSIGSATSAGDDEYTQDSMEDCEDFLEWYYSPSQESQRLAIEARLEKALGPSDKSWRRSQERQSAARAKAFRSRADIAKARETALLDSFNEEDKKVRARVEKMGTSHLRRVQQCIAERRGRAREVHPPTHLCFLLSISVYACLCPCGHFTTFMTCEPEALTL